MKIQTRHYPKRHLFISCAFFALIPTLSFAEMYQHMGHESTQHSMQSNLHHDDTTQHTESHTDSHSGEHNMADGNKSVFASTSVLNSGKPLLTLPQIKNLSDAPRHFKAELNPTPTDVNLLNNQPTQMWLYNQTLLPLIDVNVGDSVEISVKNNLSEPTTIHWHGLDVPPSQDGNPHDPILAGQSGKYQFEITPDMVGSHWFHPHTDQLTGKQVSYGLAGLFIVRDPNDPLKNIPEKNLFFSDLKLDEQGQIAQNSMMDMMNGREGQFALINGQLEPMISLEGTERWRLWNGNSARYLNFDFSQDEMVVYLVGTDGGLIEHPRKITQLLLTPGERVELIAVAQKESQFALVSKAYDRQKMGNVDAKSDTILGQIKTTIAPAIEIPETLRSINDFGAPTVKRQVILSEEMPMRFLINGKTHDMNRIDFMVKKGEVEEWEVTNASHMDHNFHIHGGQFAVKEFELNGKITVPEFKLRKDTINIKPGETARILTVQNYEGIRMYHCHILEHEDLGMMGQLEVR